MMRNFTSPDCSTRNDQNQLADDSVDFVFSDSPSWVGASADVIHSITPSDDAGAARSKVQNVGPFERELCVAQVREIRQLHAKNYCMEQRNAVVGAAAANSVLRIAAPVIDAAAEVDTLRTDLAIQQAELDMMHGEVSRMISRLPVVLQVESAEALGTYGEGVNRGRARMEMMSIEASFDAVSLLAASWDLRSEGVE
jgi:hypothetical protein